jgi:phosphoglycolate phosphatase
VLVAKALGVDVNPEELAHALKLFLTHYEEHKMDNTCAYPGVPEALEQLSALPMAVLTNKPVRISERILQALGLAKYFRAIYGGNSFPTKKPDPQGAFTILRELDIAPVHAMLVGDSEVDVQTARNAGMLTATVNYGFGIHNRETYPADLYLDRLADIIPALAVIPS